MANICDNTFWAYSEDPNNIDAILNYFNNSKFEVEVVNDNDDQVDIYFDSKWVFPEKEMNQLFEEIPNKEDIYMRCLSVEYGNLYHALWVCDEDGWEEV